jgi:rhodanese-related sulfurtransferase
MRNLLFLTFLLTTTMVCAQFESIPITTMEKDQEEQIILVDVRTKEEFDQGHLCDALNIDFKADDFKANIQKLPKSSPVYLYCRTGKRSKSAATILKGLGFENITNLEGGYVAYTEAGGTPCPE